MLTQSDAERQANIAINRIYEREKIQRYIKKINLARRKSEERFMRMVGEGAQKEEAHYRGDYFKSSFPIILQPPSNRKNERDNSICKLRQ